MQSLPRVPRASPPLLVRCVLLALVGLCAPACAEDAAPIAPAPSSPSARVVVPGAPEGDASRPPNPAPTIDVGGRVVDDREEPIVGRPLTLVDARNQRTEVLTDEEGGFFVAEVTSPYDVLITPAPSGSVITPVAYLGLARSAPRLEVFEREGPTPRLPNQSLRLRVKLPPCPASLGPCWVSVVSASAGGGGGTAGSYTEGADTAAYELEHAWQAEALRPAESVDLHVLVGSAQYTYYAYASVLHLEPRPGETTDAGVAFPQPIEASEPVTIAGHAVNLPESWEWTLASQLELPDGAMLPLRYDWSAVSALRVPRLPGATWRVGVWAQHPPVEERPYFHRSAQAWSGSLPLTATNVSVDLPRVPEPARPTVEGRVSRGGLGLAWDGRSPALASAVVVDLGRGGQLFRAYTSDPAIAFARLEALGLPRLTSGEHVLDLTTTPGANIDELTEPAPHLRRDRLDLHVPGSMTYQRFRFMVTP